MMVKAVNNNKKLIVVALIILIVLWISYFIFNKRNYSTDKNWNQTYSTVNIVLEDNKWNKYNVKINENYKDCFLSKLKLNLISTNIVEKSFSLPKTTVDCIVKKWKFQTNEISKKWDMVLENNLLHMLKSEIKVKYKNSIKITN